MKIPINKIKLLRRHLRHEVSDESVRDLVVSFSLPAGQLQPILVRKIENGWELVAGRRRLKAAELCGWTEIEAFEKELTGAMEIPAFTENVSRKQMDPVEEAETIVWMHDEQNMSISEIAEQTGHSDTWVNDRLAIANYPQNFKDALAKRKISLGGAGQLMLIEDAEMRDWYLHCAKVNGASIEQCEAWLLAWQAQRKLSHPEGIGEPTSHPHPLPLPIKTPCFTCMEPVANNDAVVVRICIPCHTEINAQKIQQLPLGTNEKDNQDARGSEHQNEKA